MAQTNSSTGEQETGERTMPSKLAMKVAARVANDSLSVSAATDAELSEVREVLDELGRELHRHLHANVLIPFEQCAHSRCQRARVVYGKLKTD